MDNRGGDSVGFFVYFQDSLTSFDVFFKYFLKVPLRSINYKHYKWYIESDQIIPLRFVVNFVGIGGSSLVTGPGIRLRTPTLVSLVLLPISKVEIFNSAPSQNFHDRKSRTRLGIAKGGLVSKFKMKTQRWLQPEVSAGWTWASGVELSLATLTTSR